ncbi:uncharacterized protein LOC144767131 [Lissotriton helveticus]
MEFSMWKDYLGLLEVIQTRKKDPQGRELRPTYRPGQGDKDTTPWSSEGGHFAPLLSSKSEGVTPETASPGRPGWAPLLSHRPEVDMSDITPPWSLKRRGSSPWSEPGGFCVSPSWWSERREEVSLLSLRPEGDISPTPSPWRGERGGWTLQLSPRPEVETSDTAPQHARKTKRLNTSPREASATPGGRGVESQEKVLQVRPSDSSPPHSGAQESSSGCAFCKHNGEPRNIYSTHALKDARGCVQCPVLRQYVCPQCQGTGDSAHTRRFCPLTEKGYASVYQGTAGSVTTERRSRTERRSAKA